MPMLEPSHFHSVPQCLSSYLEMLVLPWVIDILDTIDNWAASDICHRLHGQRIWANEPRPHWAG